MTRAIVTFFYLAAISLSALAGELTEDIELKGDLRYRHEMIDTESGDPRHRNRLRARLSVEGKVNDNTRAVIQLATGSDDPVSTNQTLGDGFSTKNLMLDMAYLEYEPVWLSGLVITGGKFKNPFYLPGHSELLWDSDLNPEGGVAEYEKLFESFSVSIIGAGLWIEERSAGRDSWLAAGQAILKYRPEGAETGFNLGGGAFNYVNARGFSPFFDATEPMGNSLDTDGNYAVGFELIELFAEGTHEFSYFPVTVMFDFVTNTGADSMNNGWLAGIRAGKTQKPGSWDFRYIYRELEKDAVIGMFTDSDFRDGGTDARGHEIGAGYQVAVNSTANITYFKNKIGLDDGETDFSRLQVDLQLKF